MTPRTKTRRAPAPPPPVPPLHIRAQPGLSDTLPGPRHPARCQACSGAHTKADPLTRWLEHNEFDQLPVHVHVVVLHQSCADRLIEPHPRLYKQLVRHSPFPGCMSICLRCPRRDGVSCTSPLSKLNGGPGLRFDFGERSPMVAHLYFGGGRGRWVQEYYGAIEDCSGRPMVTT